MKEVRAVVRDGSSYWAASSGGLFRWTPAPSQFLLLTNAEGLQTIDLTAVNVDRHGDVWTGSSNGTVHAYTPSTGTFRPVLDIATSNQTNKRINSITFAGDTALFSTEFGLSLFHIGRFEFGDTYSRFGTIAAGTRATVTSAALHGGKIWACVSDGQATNRVAVASLANPNLLPPEAWTLQMVGGSGAIPKVLTVFGGKLYAGTSTGLYVEQSGVWNEVAALTGKNIVSLASSPSLLAVTWTISSTMYPAPLSRRMVPPFSHRDRCRRQRDGKPTWQQRRWDC
jgi:outer membrane protein assembly factor BamB